MLSFSVDKGVVKIERCAFSRVKWYERIVRDVRKEVTTLPSERSIALVGDIQMRLINKQSRRLDKVTDVLSFLYSPQEGEIIIDIPQAERQYKRFKSKTLESELQRLVVHGLLHLAGHDHKRMKEKKEMERLTTKILKSLSTL